MIKRVVVGMLALALLAGASVRADALRIDGSTTVGPIADAFAEYFKSVDPKLEITVKKTGSGDGAAALIDSRCDIATMSRFMKPEEFTKAVGNNVLPVAWTVAMDGVCVVVHPSNPVAKLTSEQVRDIYTGKITNWSQVGGPSMPIVVISRDTSSGTYETFETLIMKKQPMAAGVEYVNANPQAQARVRTTQGAVGYVGLGFLEGVKALTIDGVAPSRQTVANGTYPLSRPLFMFTNGFPKLGSVVYRFVTFYLSEKGQELIEAKGYVPLTNY
jgi:phosphate transport system substrate-binding protein